MLDTQTNKKRPKVANISTYTSAAGVRLRRNMVGLSQEKLGRRRSASRFSKSRNMRRAPTASALAGLQAIATTLHVPVSYFFEDVGDGSAGETAGTDERIVRETMLSREGITLMRCLAAIRSPSVKTKLISLAKALAADRPDEDEPVPAEARASQPA
jgi:transcriptional regulator with XRE-family HTH domain